MTKASRLKRLELAQQRLRTLELMELERCRHALAQAESARQFVLESVSGAGSADLAWLVARSEAPHRTERDVAQARKRVSDQTARLADIGMVGRLIGKLHTEALLRERCRGEASELAETLERFAVSHDDSAAQD